MRGKIARSFELPLSARDNTPEAIDRDLRDAARAGLLPPFPFGTDFTEVEQRLLPALQALKSASPAGLAAMVVRGLMSGSTNDKECLTRLGLARPRSASERFYAALVRGALQ